MNKLRFAVLFAVSALAAGCSDTDARFAATSPTGFGMSDSVTAEIAPPLISSRPTGQSACPDVSPFVGSLTMNIRAAGLGLRLHEVRLVFTDINGLTAPPITLPAPVLTSQFGSTLIAARSTRAFPFSFPLGCFSRHAGTLVIVIVTVDERGREVTNELRVGVQ